MSLTVEEMLQIGVLSDVKILAGEQGLSNRIVKTVVVIDVPNAGQWVRGGEFLLTSGYLFANDSLSFVDLVDSLAKKNAAALGVKIGRFLNKVPDEAIVKANKYDFPILKIPTFMNHVDIINPVLSAIVNSQYKLLETTEAIRTEFLNSLLLNKGIEDMLNILARFLNVGVAYIDEIFGIGYGSENSSFKDTCVVPDMLSEIIKDYTHVKITNANKTIGHLVFEKEPSYLTRFADVAIREAQRALLLHFQRMEFASKVERRHKDAFIKDILYSKFKKPAEVFLQAKVHGWDPGWKLVVATIKTIEENKSTNNTTTDALPTTDALVEEEEHLLNFLNEKLNVYFPGTMATNISPYFVALIPLKEEKDYIGLCKTIEKLHDVLTRYMESDVVVSVSSAKKDLSEAPHAFSESLETLDILRRMEQKPGVYSWCDLGVEKILCALKGSEISRNFWRKTLGKLIDMKDESSLFLFQTLEALISNDWQLKQTADFLHIHYNTLKYRIKRLEDILGIDGLSEGKRRFDISLAFMLYKLENSDPLTQCSRLTHN